MMKINITILEDSISEFNRLQKGSLIVIQDSIPAILDKCKS